MLPELIRREEEHENYPLLVLLGAASGFFGFAAASTLFPSETSVLAVAFASIPMIYPLVSYFMEREQVDKYYIPEMKVYGSLFLGQVLAFFALGFYAPEAFTVQLDLIGVTGYAVAEVSFENIFVNNMIVFGAILGASALIGSAGAFILTWNASVMGVFFADLVREQPIQPFAYVPHATFEMLGFIVAGIAGTIISASVYREHFDRELWRNLLVLLTIGTIFVLVGAVLETFPLILSVIITLVIFVLVGAVLELLSY